MSHKTNHILPLALLATLIGFMLFGTASCKRNELLTTPGIQLAFSTDTLTFDTVFTQMGTATRKFKIYNPYDQPIHISRVWLAGGQSSVFRINVDGDAGLELNDIEVPAFDSIYVFANVTIDPNNTNNPLVIFDSVMVETNGSVQSVVLEAWGQDAEYIGQVGYLTIYRGDNLVFTPDKPYVLMGIVAIDSFASLTIQAGTRVHMFGGPTSRPGERAMLYIGDQSTLRVEGTKDMPVKFLTHRLEEDFQDLPFQWEAIRLSQNSRDNYINYAIIRNSLYGVWVDSLSTNANPKLVMRNTTILNVAEAGILGLNGSIYADNCVVANSSKWDALLVYGGDYTFNHCTFANYGTGLVNRANKPIFAMRNYLVVYDNDGNEVLLEAPGNVEFNNCILYGSQFNEVEFDKGENTTAELTWRFDHCLLRADTLNTNLIDCFKNTNPYFAEPDDYDFRLDTLISPARNTGKLNLLDYSGMPIPYDQDGNARDGLPDMGAYEFPQ